MSYFNTPPKLQNLVEEEEQQQQQQQQPQSQMKWREDFEFRQKVQYFEELVKGSFFDKTNFIKDFIQHLDSIIQINRPRRWGKSLTLKMIQTFLQPHIDDITEFTDEKTFKYDFKQGKRNWQYFKDLNISKDKEFVEKYFGQYPVLYVDLKDVYGDNQSMMLKSLQRCVRNTYHNHSYVYERLKNIYNKTSSMIVESQIKLFSEYYQMQNNDLTDSLRFLSELLYEYFNKKVIVLIDEYDNAMMKMMNDGLKGMENQQLREWTSYQISSILGCLIKGNDKVQKALLTGILDSLQKESGSGLNVVQVLSLAQNLHHPLQLMIGLTEVEIETFIKQNMIAQEESFSTMNRKSKVEQFLTNIKLWYNGFDLRQGQKSVSLYTPYSVGCYLFDVHLQRNDKFIPSPQSYWIKTGGSEILENLTKLKTSKKFQLTLLNYILEEKELVRNKCLNVPSLLVSADSQTIKYDNLALEVLQQLGYLKISKQESQYKYTNLETKNYFKERLVEIIQESCQIDENTLKDFYKDKFITFEKERFRSFVQESILNKLPMSQHKVENEFYFQALLTCFSIYSYLHGGKVTMEAGAEYKNKFNKKIDNVFFPVKGSEKKLVIHEYKCTFSEGNAQSLLEKAIWQIYAKCYMSGFTSSKDWDLIVVRAIVLYQDREYKWHLKMEEYQHLNQVAQILIENCFLKDKQLLKNCEDLAEGRNNSRQKFLEQYGCKDFNDFIKYFVCSQQDLQGTNEFQQEDENYQEQFDQMKISEEKQNLFDKVGKEQLQKIEELLKRKEEYFKNKIQVEHQCLSKPEKSVNKPISVKQKVEDDRTKIRKSEHEDVFREKRKIRKEEQVEEGIQEGVVDGNRKEKGLEQLQGQKNYDK